MTGGAYVNNLSEESGGSAAVYGPALPRLRQARYDPDNVSGETRTFHRLYKGQRESRQRPQ